MQEFRYFVGLLKEKLENSPANEQINSFLVSLNSILENSRMFEGPLPSLYQESSIGETFERIKTGLNSLIV